MTPNFIATVDDDVRSGVFDTDLNSTVFDETFNSSDWVDLRATHVSEGGVTELEAYPDGSTARRQRKFMLPGRGESRIIFERERNKKNNKLSIKNLY